MESAPRSSLGAWLRSVRSDASPRSVFTMLWLGAIIAHHDERMAWHRSAQSLVEGGSLVEALPLASMLVALAGLFCARSRGVFASALVLQVTVFLVELPRTANHWLITSTVSVALLAALAVEAWRPRPDRRADLAGLAPGLAVARLVTVLVYLLAVLHKTNTDYLDPVNSCAMHFYEQSRLVPWFPTLPADLPLWAAVLLVHGVHLHQLAIAVLLSIRRTWLAGIVVGFAFHAMTGLVMRDFPTVMLVLHFLFVPADVQARICARVEGAVRRLTRGLAGLPTLIQAEVLIWSAWSLGNLEHPQPVVPGQPMADGVFWEWLRAWNLLALGALIVFVWLVLAEGLHRSYRPTLFRTGRLAFHVIPLLFILNGLTPYLGFKDTGAMNMYSNLRPYEGSWNHMLPGLQRLKIFPYVDRGIRPDDPWYVHKLSRVRYPGYREHGRCR